MSVLWDCPSALRASCSRPRLRPVARRVLPALSWFGGSAPRSVPAPLRVVGAPRVGFRADLRSRPVPAMARNYDVWPRR